MQKEFTILLIDDNIKDVSEFRQLLLSLEVSHTLIHYRSGKNAVQHFSAAGKTVPDFVFIDALLPGMSSFVTSYELRAIPALHSVPIILYSSVQPTAYEDVAKIMGATCCIQKRELEIFSNELARLMVNSLPHAKSIAPRQAVA